MNKLISRMESKVSIMRDCAQQSGERRRDGDHVNPGLTQLQIRFSPSARLPDSVGQGLGLSSLRSCSNRRSAWLKIPVPSCLFPARRSFSVCSIPSKSLSARPSAADSKPQHACPHRERHDPPTAVEVKKISSRTASCFAVLPLSPGSCLYGSVIQNMQCGILSRPTFCLAQVVRRPRESAEWLQSDPVPS